MELETISGDLYLHPCENRKIDGIDFIVEFSCKCGFKHQIKMEDLEKHRDSRKDIPDKTAMSILINVIFGPNNKTPSEIISCLTENLDMQFDAFKKLNYIPFEN